MTDEIVTPQKLIDASLDCDTIRDVVSGDDQTDVTSRLGRTMPTIAKALRLVLQQSMDYYATQEELTESVPIAGTKAAKALDTGTIFLYENDAWVSTGFSEIDQAKAFIHEQLALFTESKGKNLYNPANAQIGKRLNGIGVFFAVAQGKCTEFINVESGQEYTISCVGNRPATFVVFAEDKTTIALINTTTTTPISFTVPSNGRYLVVNIQSETVPEPSNFQIEKGAVATAYAPYTDALQIKMSALPENVVTTENIAELSKKDYEITVISRNLFDDEDTIPNYFLSTANGGLSPSAGWRVSGFIPVTEGKKYTLSGTRARQGVSFFATNTISTTAALLYDNTTTLPLTVTAPVGAKYAVIALESSTVKGWDKLQFEEGDKATEYSKKGSEALYIDPSYIYGAVDDTKTHKASIKLLSGAGSIKAGLLELGLKVFNPLSSTLSSAFNFNNDSYNSVQIRVNGDDIAPVRMMGATVGANHGYARSNVTLAGHGKTAADIGSVWTDGTNQWVIVQINSVNVIGITCRDKQLAYSASQLPQLTHVSGASNTASFKPTATSGVQWYPMLKNHTVKLLIDGKEATEITVDQGYDHSVQVVESYDLMEKNDIAEWVIANKGAYNTPYNAESALNVSMNYTFDAEGSCVIPTNFFTYKALSTAQDLMFTQSARLKPGVDGSIKYYVPRSIAFSHDAQNFDFSVPTIVDDLTITNRIDFTVAKTETGEAVPDRLIMLNNSIGYAVGYLPILDAAPDVRNSLTSKGIQISQFEAKVYPYLVDGLTNLPAGASYSAVCYRKYFKRPTEPKRTCDYSVENYLFLDWHGGDFTDVVQLDDKFSGRAFEVVEQTDNVELLSKVATGSVAVKVGTIVKNARLILKFI